MIKGLPRGGPSSYNQNSNGVEVFGLLEVRAPKETETEAETATATATDADADVAAAPSVLHAKREVVRFTTESMTSQAEETTDAAEEKEQKPRSKGKRGPTVPVFGDEVRFRVAIHRKTGRKRAVDLVITCSAKAKLEKEIDAKLASMTREQGVVDSLKSGGGFIRCCDRPEDVYFAMHELRADDEEVTAVSSPDDKDSPRRNSRSSKNRITVREGDEVSFFVYEDHDDDNASGRSRPRLMALRVQKLPSGTVSFEDVLRANIEGVITKAPKEPRNAPEVMGVITPDIPSTVQAQGDEVEATAAPPTSSNSKKKSKGPKPGTLVFRRSDTQEMSYAPLAGDRVLLDEVFDKRTRKMKAVNVRVLQLNPKNRTQGVISSVKEEFGFIKLVDRTADAFFRFSDVMSSHRDFRVDTEVAFDVAPGDGGKSDNLRATRVELLPAGSIQWESVLAQGLEGVILSVPSSSSSNNSRRTFKQSTPQNGRIRWTAPTSHLIDFIPELKEQIDAVFLTQEKPKKKKKDAAPKDEEAKTAEDATETPRRELVLPSSLSKFERAALHEYCEWLGIEHGSVDVRPGSGALQRQLQLSSPGIVANKPIDAESGQVPEIILDFKLDDVTEVRYDPRVGDRVSFTLAQIKRTKQFACKSVVLVEAAAAAPRSANAPEKKKTAELPTGEGVIVVLKTEGFGFIEPVPTGAAQDLSENLFFHIKEVTSGETLEQLKEGMEVTFRMQFDDKKKKTRAVGITVVPEGTIKKVELLTLRGVVTRPSFLQRMKKAGGSSRYNKNQQPVSTVGKIRLVVTGSSDEDSADAGADDDEADAAEEEGEEKDDSGEDAEKSKAESEVQGEPSDETSVETESKSAKKKPTRVAYVYHLQDIVDQTVILREGDEVEFLAQTSTGKKGAQRASKIRVVASHAKQGVVVRVQDDGSGVIRVDPAVSTEEAAEPTESPLEIPFIARNVLRSDALNEGDRVEFAHVKTPLPGLSNAATAAAAVPTDSEAQETTPSPPKDVGHATSILRLSSSEEPRRGSRAVNSTLLQAMRQVGATAVAKSRMAKGPDGTRGFPEGWRASLATTTSA